MFSTNKKEIINDCIFNIQGENTLTDIAVTDDDVKEAINCIPKGSSAGPDGITAIFLQNTKEILKTPLSILCQKSINESNLTYNQKLQLIVPQHKGGSRHIPKNYRPISLTSHITKIYERIIKKYIMRHLISNNLLNKGQHGFVPGRSTQTQLLLHFETIYSALMGNNELDVVYLDFAKAFDKVSHKILLSKVVKQGIGGKLVDG